MGEAERLQIALPRPHRKQSRCLGADGAGAQVQGQVYGNSLVEAGGQFEQPSGDRNPKGLGPEFSSIFELNGCGGSFPQVDARGADFSI